MSDHNYYTALSHVLLAGTSIYCLNKNFTNMGIVCYGLIATNSLLGVWRWGNPEVGPKAKQIYDVTGICQEIIALGAVSAAVWTSSPILPELWMIQILLPSVPLAFYLLDKNYKDYEKIAMAVNGVSIAFVSLMNNNFWGVAAAISFLFGYLYVKEKGSIRDIPAIDLINYELCFFCFFSSKAIRG
ncbi:hypothetical protein WA026_003162 [Henosepilachna vigintioctopunctata]|uniref:Uncharacterized protein n=1 Tax=Henosepilachna vigintioctopunctata TaxID=420089 RepID=A0AAW1TMA9_9CUCU